ncbi:hypothetical protein [Thermococcus stetteri]|uniref:hypothetical protein n=1 Tax=Thermococcus stetteri TaxID=49900 RepID=UPI001AE2B595|nr:hypothetical protein [Thermococcus stetteri]MBP1911501.1 polyferredoxin [Thermococcus stetteri]
MTGMWSSWDWGDHIGVLVKFIISFLLLYHIVTSFILLSLYVDLSPWLGVLYVLSIGFAFYSLFVLFMNERRGIWCSFLCFGLFALLNLKLGFSVSYSASYSGLGVALVLILLLFRMLEKESNGE